MPLAEEAPAATASDAAPGAARLFLAGIGSVGGTLLRQLQMLPEGTTAPRVVGACTTRRGAWYDVPRDAADVDADLADGTVTDWPALLERIEHAAEAGGAPLIFVDATDSVDVAQYHARLLEAGCSVVTPSKHALTLSLDYYDRLQRATEDGPATYHYETTAGAGLPVVRTVRDLVASGDRVESVRGAASGTLSFLFSRLRAGVPFSDAVGEAIDHGYAEPDVREDLSGNDVARKFLILGRSLGLRLEKDDLDVESLVPEALRDATLDGFLDALPDYDDQWADRTRRAQEQGRTLQYVGRLADDAIRVAVEEVPADDSFGLLSGTDNLFVFQTARYGEDTPLAVRGPGAGPRVTAAGVLADVLEAARLRGA